MSELPRHNLQGSWPQTTHPVPPETEMLLHLRRFVLSGAAIG